MSAQQSRYSTGAHPPDAALPTTAPSWWHPGHWRIQPQKQTHTYTNCTPLNCGALAASQHGASQPSFRGRQPSSALPSPVQSACFSGLCNGSTTTWTPSPINSLCPAGPAGCSRPSLMPLLSEPQSFYSRRQDGKAQNSFTATREAARRLAFSAQHPSSSDWNCCLLDPSRYNGCRSGLSCHIRPLHGRWVLRADMLSCEPHPPFWGVECLALLRLGLAVICAAGGSIAVGAKGIWISPPTGDKGSARDGVGPGVTVPGP
jgi:hypothetical protein